MKYSERFFEFPVRIFDRFKAEKAMEQEQTADVPIEGDWIAGKAKIPFQEISSWSDYFDSTQGVEGVESDGFKFTLVWTNNEGTYISIWKKEKFEQKLNEFVEKFEAWAKEKLDYHMSEMSKLNEIRVQ